MSDIKLNQFGCADKAKFNFKRAAQKILWHCDVPTHVDFFPPDANCFGIPSIDFPQGQTPLDATPNDTRFQTPCRALDTYDIIFTNPQPHKKKAAKKAVKKAAKKAPAKKAAKKPAKKAAKKKAPAKKKAAKRKR
jgi:hypothetical protein